MKLLSSFYKLLLVGSCCTLLTLPARAQEPEPQQTSAQDRPKNKWYAPDYLALQHAGLIGFLSAGTGYDFGKQDRTNLEALYGFTPGYDIKHTNHTFTLRTYYQSHAKPLFKDVKISWIRAGAGISLTVGEQFESFFPARYPEGYYIWPTATRILPFVGTALSKEFTGKNRLHYTEFYTELGTSDVMLVDKYRNSGISMGDIVNLSFGLRYML